MKPKVYTGAAILALAALFGTGSVLLGKRTVVHAGAVMAPKFEVDPFWPKPLPNHWVLGQVIGASVDSSDDVWIVHRPGTMEVGETKLERNQGECCVSAPDVLEFDPAGNLIRHWGKADPNWHGGEGHDW